jgi:hypothetical protein
MIFHWISRLKSYRTPSGESLLVVLGELALISTPYALLLIGLVLFNIGNGRLLALECKETICVNCGARPYWEKPGVGHNESCPRDYYGTQNWGYGLHKWEILQTKEPIGTPREIEAATIYRVSGVILLLLGCFGCWLQYELTKKNV